MKIGDKVRYKTLEELGDQVDGNIKRVAEQLFNIKFIVTSTNKDNTILDNLNTGQRNSICVLTCNLVLLEQLKVKIKVSDLL